VTSVIEVEHLGKRFGEFTAVRDVSFAVSPGEIFGYLGANGAGKSTTIRILCGLMTPTTGSARVAGHDVASDTNAVRMAVGYMSQKFSLYPDLSAIENMDFFGGAYHMPRARRLARARTLLEEVDLSADANVSVSQLPGGKRQRLALATALLHEPHIVFLDEPTAGVDPAARRNFWRIIRRLSDAGTTVFVTTHYMDEAEYCHRVGLMVAGELVALDTPAALKKTHVHGTLLAARGKNLRADALRAMPGVADVTPFGAGLHVRCAEDALIDEGALRAELERCGASDVRVERTEPTLEDVFLAVTTGQGAT
jgi:drug efflux transport system ATP-binding protein